MLWNIIISSIVSHSNDKGGDKGFARYTFRMKLPIRHMEDAKDMKAFQCSCCNICVAVLDCSDPEWWSGVSGGDDASKGCWYASDHWRRLPDAELAPRLRRWARQESWVLLSRNDFEGRWFSVLQSAFLRRGLMSEKKELKWFWQ